MSGLNYEARIVRKTKLLSQTSKVITHLYRMLGHWGYYALIASTLLVSCIQEATGNIKPNSSTQLIKRTPASELCIVESKSASNNISACSPQLASGGFLDLVRILNSNKLNSFSKPLNKTVPDWERNIVEPH